MSSILIAVGGIVALIILLVLLIVSGSRWPGRTRHSW